MQAGTLLKIKKDYPAIVYATKTGLTLVIVYACCVLLNASLFEKAWALLSIFMVLDPDYRTAFIASKYRLIGTAIGGVLAIIFLVIFPKDTLIWQLIGLFIMGAICGKLYQINPVLRTAGITACVLYLMGLADFHPFLYTIERFCYVGLAVVVSFLIAII